MTEKKKLAEKKKLPYDETEYLFDDDGDASSATPAVTLNLNLAWLAEAQAQPFFTEAQAFSDIEVEIPPARACQGGVFFAFYHKTGCVWSGGALMAFGPPPGYPRFPLFYQDGNSTIYPEGSSLLSFLQGELPSMGLGFVAKVSNPGDELSFPSDACVVHLQRRPEDFVLSSYRYHANHATAEWWEDMPVTCHRCGHDDLVRLFGTCNSRCSFFDLLQAVDEEAGLVIDSTMERKTISNMVRNLHRWRNHPQVLHLSMEHLASDYDGTMRCMLRFLRIADGDGRLLTRLQELDLGRQPHNVHETRTIYNNTALRAFLETRTAWNSEFRAAASMAGQIYQRQAGQYGCPIPAQD